MTGTQLAIWTPATDTQLSLDFTEAPATPAGASASQYAGMDPEVPPQTPASACGCCARQPGEEHIGHTYRPTGSARPRGEIVFPVGSLVRLAGGPRWSRGCLGVVTEVASKAMRQVELGQIGAPGGMWECIGVKGLELCDGRPAR